MKLEVVLIFFFLIWFGFSSWQNGFSELVWFEEGVARGALPREAVAVPFLEVFKARSHGVWSNLG